ncbi:aminotransferase class V-fold PLP-dependent enzyme [Aquicella lusitana]|uniref:Glutamate/tyrosine decarboxylase-like PLP-dependent enzyme n=1 Tax=Aquicella lusitana TaxID=254246 RepID=A0A370GFY6_9COXI|nr:aminotransferase class V-fold PLP-dependent enzyme [Aquicella lusitana]RDI41304.1 glutamate/tyrosine decarboxylase-like PLP-dependent enzyme [Aquicella lusitana]VVC72329.1 putative sphingosine-1-phosphate lyase [Aquicella lusitana]
MLSGSLQMANWLGNYVNETLEDYSPVTIITALLLLQYGPRFAYQTYSLYHEWDTKKIKETLMNNAVKKTLQVPVVGRIADKLIRGEVTKNLNGYKVEIEADREKSATPPIHSLPPEGYSIEEIRKVYPKKQIENKKGRLSGAIYSEYPPEFSAFLEKLYGETALTNPMHPVFKDIKKKEAEVISWCRKLFNGPDGTHGVITAGGTLSIFEACKAYVLHARKNGNQAPEIIVPSSAHPAFWKAAEILNAKLVVVPVDKNTGRADVNAMKAAINRNTCMMAASAPSFPFGVIDPIKELAEIAQNNKDWLHRSKPIPFHVDACLGGFLTAFAKKAGVELPWCDFQNEGVSSVSADIHKYGEGPKGVSIILFRRRAEVLIAPTPTHTYLTSSVGSYVTPGLPGSRTGVQVVTAHAVMLYQGENGYVKDTAAILALAKELTDEVKKIDGIIVPYSTQLSVVGMRTTSGINPLLVAELMKSHGWELNCLLTSDYQADGFHFCLTALHTKVPDFVKDFVTDLKKSVDYVKQNPHQKPKGIAKAYGVLATGFVPSVVQDLIGDMYVRIDQSLPGNNYPGYFWPKATPQSAITETDKKEEEKRYTKKNL